MKDYLDRIEATPAEREACILAVAESCRFPIETGPEGKDLIEALEGLRQWVGIEDPGLVDGATAKAVGRLIEREGIDYADAASFVLRCHQLSGNDELLLALLQGDNGWNHKELARPIAAKLADEKQRAKYLEKLK